MSEWRQLVEMLSEVYDDRGVAIWLQAPQRRWGERYHGWQKWVSLASSGGLPNRDTYLSALDLIKEGRIEEVLAAAEQLVTGAHS